MTRILAREEIDAWQESIIGKPCSKHPTHTVQEGKYGPYCGVKTAFGWCDGGWPSEEWLDNFRKEEYAE